jgi:hypothetical protein
MFKAAITVEGTREYLGTFANAEDAARAWNARAREVHGIFAYQNVIADADGKAKVES